MNVVIVESAAKAKTINKYLGKDFKVIASYGHVRDLPSSDGSVEPDNDFNMHWDIDTKSKKIMKDITDAVKSANKLILATDPDREGEAISWHILEILAKRKALTKSLEVERVAFNAVTKQAIMTALENPRKIDQPLVSAYLARRALDYLVGFTLSPVLWRKLPGARSAGRVQSVALRLICDREAEIEAFTSQEYWSITTDLLTDAKEDVPARLVAIDGKALQKLDIKDEAQAHAIESAIKGGAFQVSKIEKKSVKRNPYPPFTTSTLQQDASRKLGFSASQTMQVAQRLYEGVAIGGETVGLITYMRTDGVQIIPEVVDIIRKQVAADYGKNYLPPFVRKYQTKAKNAQEAHEAIRPTDISRKPQDMAKYLNADQAKLYELIWMRSIASQMASAEIDQTRADIAVTGSDSKSYGLRATGSIVAFDGFQKVYDEGRDERQKASKGKDDPDTDDDEARRLPPLKEGQALTENGVSANQHFTQPPPRFSEATLVKRMEELGIGRPSTYASTLAVLQSRDYVRMEKKRLYPEDKGRLVIAFLESFFGRYVEFDFTADLEEKLDLISDGKLDWKQVLRDFWKDFTGAIGEIKDLRVSEVLDALNEMLGPHVFPPREGVDDPRKCPACDSGRLSLKISGKFGAFIGCENYPDCRYTRQLSESTDSALAEASGPDGKQLGLDPDTGLPITLRTGRFGPYLQLGEQDGDEKPKRASIPKGFDAANIDFETAVKLLSLPRDVGEHPETGKTIVAGLGRYGPFVLHDGMYANVESVEDVFTIGLNRAVTVLAEKKAGKGGRFGRGAARKVIKDLGEHPVEGGTMEVLDGRYGPYVTHNKVNATIPKGSDPAGLSVDEAVRLLAERAAKGKRKAKPKAKAKPRAKTKPKAKAKTPAKKKAAAKSKKAAGTKAEG